MISKVLVALLATLLSGAISYGILSAFLKSSQPHPQDLPTTPQREKASPTTTSEEPASTTDSSLEAPSPEPSVSSDLAEDATIAAEVSVEAADDIEIEPKTIISEELAESKQPTPASAPELSSEAATDTPADPAPVTQAEAELATEAKPTPEPAATVDESKNKDRTDLVEVSKKIHEKLRKRSFNQIHIAKNHKHAELLAEFVSVGVYLDALGAKTPESNAILTTLDTETEATSTLTYTIGNRDARIVLHLKRENPSAEWQIHDINADSFLSTAFSAFREYKPNLPQPFVRLGNKKIVVISYPVASEQLTATTKRHIETLANAYSIKPSPKLTITIPVTKENDKGQISLNRSRAQIVSLFLLYKGVDDEKMSIKEAEGIALPKGVLPRSDERNHLLLIME